MTIQEIERQIKKLPRPRLADFRAWFQRFDSKSWDTQMARDVKSGKLNRLAEKALASYKLGKAKEL